jgi:hypothetical protein
MFIQPNLPRLLLISLLMVFLAKFGRMKTERKTTKLCFYTINCQAIISVIEGFEDDQNHRIKNK